MATSESEPRPGYLWAIDDRVELIYLAPLGGEDGGRARPQPGDRGTVTGVDGTGTIWVRWDTGIRTGVLPGLDRIEPVD